MKYVENNCFVNLNLQILHLNLYYFVIIASFMGPLLLKNNVLRTRYCSFINRNNTENTLEAAVFAIILKF